MHINIVCWVRGRVFEIVGFEAIIVGEPAPTGIMYISCQSHPESDLPVFPKSNLT